MFKNNERVVVDKKVKELEEELKNLQAYSSDDEYYRARSDATIKRRAEKMKATKKQGFSTGSLWGSYDKIDIDRFKSMVLPVFSTTTGSSYDSLLDGALLLSYQTINDPNKIYSRIDNNTIDHVAMKLAIMEGITVSDMTECLVTASGMAAINMSTMPFLNAGDEFVSSSRVYGGAEQLFNVTYPKSDWRVKWVHEPGDLEKWKEQITPKTKFLYVESPGNPTLFVGDIPELAKLAHDHNIPLIVDSTIASPALLRPFEHGADIVVHSTTKIMCSSGRAIGGAIIAKDKIVTNVEGLQDSFAMQVKGGHFRNMGPCSHPPSAAALWDNLNTLEIRLKAISKRAMIIARYLEDHPKIEKVNYPGLPSFEYYNIAKKLMRFMDGSEGYSHLMSFHVKGDLETTKKFANLFDFGLQVTDLGRDYTAWVHNASTTHGQATPEYRKLAGVPDNLIRYSVGLEDADDAIIALDMALSNL